MTTVNEVINWAKILADKSVGHDQDGLYGTQCVDLPNGISSKFFGKALWGNAIDLLNSAKGNGYQVFYMPTNENPKAGDVFVTRESHQYGHTGLVIEDSDGHTMNTIEQNVDGNADALTKGGPARYIKGRRFDNVVGWFRFPYSDTVTPAKENTVNGKLTDEKGTMTVKVQAVRVRTAPNTKAESDTGYYYSNGMSLNYDSVYISDGYVWVSYKNAKGERRYVAAGVADGNRNKTPYGEFK